MAEQKPLIIVDGQIKQAAVDDILTPWPLVRNTINVGEVCTVPLGYQMIVGRKFTNSGTFFNSGDLFII